MPVREGLNALNEHEAQATIAKQPTLEGVKGPIPGSFMMTAYQRAGEEERARRVVIERGYELGPEEHRSYQEILEFMQSQEARTTL